MVSLGSVSDSTINKGVKSVTLSFRIPYFTQWGQSLLVCGSEAVVGSWDVKKGLLLKPFREGDELIWCGSIGVSSGFDFEYCYYVVDDERRVVRQEMGKKRRFVLDDEIKVGVQLRDLWQTGADALPFTSALKNVIFRTGSISDVELPRGVIQNKLDQEEADSVHVRFKLCCPNVEEDTSVYVIGSVTKLGNWKVQNGLKLNYAGESIWQADCVMKKADFPIKYSFDNRFFDNLTK